MQFGRVQQDIDGNITDNIASLLTKTPSHRYLVIGQAKNTMTHTEPHAHSPGEQEYPPLGQDP